MTTEEIANRLIFHSKTHNYFEAHEELYIPDAVSYEPGENLNEGTKGVRNIEKKWEQLQQVFNVISIEMSKPIVAGDFFCMSITQQAILKQTGQPITLAQLGVFEVKDNKIIKEWFYYPK